MIGFVVQFLAFKFVYAGEKKATEGVLGHPSVTG